MEVVGIAAGTISVAIFLIRASEKSIELLNAIQDAPENFRKLARELNRFHEALLLVRDLVERQATDDADATTMSTFIYEARRLQDMFDKLDQLLKGLSTSHRNRTIRMMITSKMIDDIIDDIISSGETLRVLSLHQFEIQQSSASYQSLLAARVSSMQLSEDDPWLEDPLESQEQLQRLQNDLSDETVTWLFEEPQFKQWETRIGKTMWCNGMGKWLSPQTHIQRLRNAKLNTYV